MCNSKSRRAALGTVESASQVSRPLHQLLVLVLLHLEFPLTLHTDGVHGLIFPLLLGPVLTVFLVLNLALVHALQECLSSPLGLLDGWELLRWMLSDLDHRASLCSVVFGAVCSSAFRDDDGRLELLFAYRLMAVHGCGGSGGSSSSARFPVVVGVLLGLYNVLRGEGRWRRTEWFQLREELLNGLLAWSAVKMLHILWGVVDGLLDNLPAQVGFFFLLLWLCLGIQRVNGAGEGVDDVGGILGVGLGCGFDVEDAFKGVEVGGGWKSGRQADRAVQREKGRESNVVWV